MGSIFAAMRRCQLFDGIPEEKYQNVLNCLHGEVRAIPKDTILLRIGDCQKRPGVVMSGTLRISLYSEDGNLLTIDRLSRGRVFGETLVCSMSQDSPIQIDALNDTEVLYLDFDPLLLQQENGCPYRMRVTANLLQEKPPTHKEVIVSCRAAWQIAMLSCFFSAVQWSACPRPASVPRRSSK